MIVPSTLRFPAQTKSPKLSSSMINTSLTHPHSTHWHKGWQIIQYQVQCLYLVIINYSILTNSNVLSS